MLKDGNSKGCNLLRGAVIGWFILVSIFVKLEKPLSFIWVDVQHSTELYTGSSKSEGRGDARPDYQHQEFMEI